VDPDGFASQFGHHAADGDFPGGLARLLENGCWRGRGERGYEYVKETFAIERAIDLHEDAYRRVQG
jgi:hypothetical protein